MSSKRKDASVLTAVGPESVADPDFDLVGEEALEAEPRNAPAASPEQAPLFGVGELVIPDAMRFLKKGVAAIHAVPARDQDSRSLNALRLTDALIIVVQMHVKAKTAEERERIVKERISPLFEVRITELARLAGIPGKNYVRLYDELRSLRETVLRWNVVGEDAKIEWEMEASFLSMLALGKNQKRGAIRFAIDPSVLEILLEPSNWAMLTLKAMHGLGSAPAYSLYQNAWRYINTQAKVTAPLPVETWIELLVGPSRFVATLSTGEKRAVNYGDFKRRVLVDAIRRVNELATLGHYLELKEIRSGNRVVRLQFKFVPKRNAEMMLPLAWPEELVAYLKQMGFDDLGLATLAQAHSYESVLEGVERLRKGVFRMAAKGEQLRHVKGYFLGILANIDQGVVADEIDDVRMLTEAAERDARERSEAMRKRLEDLYSDHVSKRFNEALFAMEDDARTKLLERFEASDQGARAQLLLKGRGWAPDRVGALALLRSWVRETDEALWKSLLPNIEDQSFDSWKDWRLLQAV